MPELLHSIFDFAVLFIIVAAFFYVGAMIICVVGMMLVPCPFESWKSIESKPKKGGQKMGKLLNILDAGLGKLLGYTSVFREITEVIDEEIKEKTGKEIFSCSDTGRTYGTVKLIQLAKNSLIIKVNHRNYREIAIMNDSYIYSALYDAAERGVSIEFVLTREASQKISRDILYLAEPFIADTDEFRSSILIDGRPGKNVYSEDGKTHFWFYWK